MELKGFTETYQPDYEAFLRNMRREETPSRAFFIELFLDGEVNDAVDKRFGICAELDKNDPDYELKRRIAIQRFMGYDYCTVGVEGLGLEYHRDTTDDTTSDMKKDGGRSWMNEHKGPVASWDDFEKYPWPDIKDLRTESAEKMSSLLPDDMCMVGFGGHFCENLTWLFGYESLCFALYDDRKLVEAVAEKIMEIELASWDALLTFDRIKVMWHSDDLGFKTGLMISPDDMREFVLSGHKILAKMGHDTGRICFLHACGKKTDILDNLIDDVQFDALHSFEDTIELVTDAKREYGSRASLLGGIDVDFLCRADEQAIRARVRDTLEICQPGGGYALGTGNTVANYIPLENYLAMLDEGRLWGR